MARGGVQGASAPVGRIRVRGVATVTAGQPTIWRTAAGPPPQHRVAWGRGVSGAQILGKTVLLRGEVGFGAVARRTTTHAAATGDSTRGQAYYPLATAQPTTAAAVASTCGRARHGRPRAQTKTQRPKYKKSKYKEQKNEPNRGRAVVTGTSSELLDGKRVRCATSSGGDGVTRSRPFRPRIQVDDGRVWKRNVPMHTRRPSRR